MKPVGLGFIGCGIAARELHWPALSRMEDKFRIVAVCNHTEPKARDFAAMVGGVPYVLDYRELLDNPGVEAVAVALPFHLNLEVTRAALERGRHVLVEKPLALNPGQAKEMAALAENHPGLVTMVAENFRYRPLYRRVRELLDGGAVGTPYFVIWNYFFFVDPEKNQYAQTPWRKEERYPGGFIVDAGVHSIAALRGFLGEILRGRGMTCGVTPQLGRLDTFSFQFETAGGVQGILNLFYSVKGLRANAIHLFGDGGTIVVERDHLVLKREEMPDVREDHPDDMGYTAEYRNFFDAIRSGAEVISTFAEARTDLEIIMRGLEAAERGGTVRFDGRSE